MSEHSKKRIPRRIISQFDHSRGDLVIHRQLPTGSSPELRELFEFATILDAHADVAHLSARRQSDNYAFCSGKYRTALSRMKRKSGRPPVHGDSSDGECSVQTKLEGLRSGCCWNVDLAPNCNRPCNWLNSYR